MVTHSNYNSLAQQDVSEKKKVRNCVYRGAPAKSCANRVQAGVGVALRQNKTFICMKMSATVFENGERRASSLLSQRFQLLTRRMIWKHFGEEEEEEVGEERGEQICLWWRLASQVHSMALLKSRARACFRENSLALRLFIKVFSLCVFFHPLPSPAVFLAPAVNFVCA